MKNQVETNTLSAGSGEAKNEHEGKIRMKKERFKLEESK